MDELRDLVVDTFLTILAPGTLGIGATIFSFCSTAVSSVLTLAPVRTVCKDATEPFILGLSVSSELRGEDERYTPGCTTRS